MRAIHKGDVYGDPRSMSKWLTGAPPELVTVLVDELFARTLARKGGVDPETGTYPVRLTDDGEYELIIGGAR
jgi:hypothetical protein